MASAALARREAGQRSRDVSGERFDRGQPPQSRGQAPAALAFAVIALVAASARADDAITAGDLRRHVEYLASDELEGRDTGSRGGALAEEHVAAHFERLGLVPLDGDDDLFQELELLRDGYDPETTWLRADVAGGPCWLEAGRDLKPLDPGDPGAFEGEVVFAGYGIVAPEAAWDDYAGLDVTGRAVLVLRHEPHEDDPRSPLAGEETSEHGSFAAKADAARARGATAVLVVTDPIHHDEADDLRLGHGLRLPPPPEPTSPPAQVTEAAGANGAGPATAAAPPTPPQQQPPPPPLPVVQISREAAELLLAGSGRSLRALQEAVDRGARPADLRVPPARVALAVARRTEPARVRARNVVAVLPGSDPALRDELVVVGAHHDHIGRFEGHGDTVFNGADDNASGTAGVLELAEAFASADPAPRRSIVFVTFTGEERGLLGSRLAVREGLIPVERVAFMLNLDMIGRNADEPVELHGDGFARGLADIASRAAEEADLPVTLAGPHYFGQSDHDPFYERDVPFLFFFTGTHDDYHQLGDHVEHLDFARMERVVRTARTIVARVADADERLAFIHHVPWLGARIEVVRRGDVLDAAAGPDGADRHVVAFTHVAEGSRAAAAGIREGDLLEEITAGDLAWKGDPAGIGAALRGIPAGSEVALGIGAVRRPAGEVTRVVETFTRPKPGWLGVFAGPIEDDRRAELGLHEGEGFVVRRAVPDGPAAAAGLKEGDLVLRIGGEPVAQRTLARRMEEIGAGVETVASVVRDGERLELPLVPGERPRR